MKIEILNINNIKIAEVTSANNIINSIDDGLNLLGDLYYQDFDKIMIYEKNIIPDFFVLKNGMVGEILQKFSNYRVQLAIIGNFSMYSTRSFNDFMYESNKLGQINFVTSRLEAIEVLSK